MKQYTRVLARVNLDAVEYNIEMMKKNINIYTNKYLLPFIKLNLLFMRFIISLLKLFFIK